MVVSKKDSTKRKATVTPTKQNKKQKAGAEAATRANENTVKKTTPGQDKTKKDNTNKKNTLKLKKGAKTDRITGHGSTTTEPPKSMKDCTCRSRSRSRSRRLDTNMFIKLNIVRSCFSRKYLQDNCVPCECYKCGTMWVNELLPSDPPNTVLIKANTEIMCCHEAKDSRKGCQRAYCEECYLSLLCDHEGNDEKDEPTILTVKGRRSNG